MDEKNQVIAWPGWETVEKLGQGSYGGVYKIKRDVFGETEYAALKHISLSNSPEEVQFMLEEGASTESITASLDESLKSIVSEYTLMRKLSGSTNIVDCDDFSYVQHDDCLGYDIFIKMELLTPLMKTLATDISEETVINVAIDMCNALELCSKHKIIHRDIKPQNIFVSANGSYKLGDFGIARLMEQRGGASTYAGTPKYMAPEVCSGKNYGSTVDIYSLGLVLYWMLNKKRLPFLPLPPTVPGAKVSEEAVSRRLGGEKIPAPATGSEQLIKIVLKACEYKPENRYQSASEMKADLLKLRNPSANEEEEGTVVVSRDKANIADNNDQTVVIKNKLETTKEKPKRKLIPIIAAAVCIVAAGAVLLGLKSNQSISTVNGIDYTETGLENGETNIYDPLNLRDYIKSNGNVDSDGKLILPEEWGDLKLVSSEKSQSIMCYSYDVSDSIQLPDDIEIWTVYFNVNLESKTIVDGGYSVCGDYDACLNFIDYFNEYFGIFKCVTESSDDYSNLETFTLDEFRNLFKKKQTEYDVNYVIYDDIGDGVTFKQDSRYYFNIIPGFNHLDR